MKCEAEALRDAIGHAVYERGTLAILEHVLLRHVESDQLSLTSSNLEVEREDWFAADFGGEEWNPICLDGKRLRAAVTGLSGTVEIRPDPGGEAVTLTQGRRRFKVPALPGSEFPLLEQHDRVDLMDHAQEIAGALKLVAYAMGKNDFRPYLNGVHLGAGRVEATDGHQVARYHFTTPPEALTGEGVIVPRNAVAPMAALLAEEGAWFSLLRRNSEVCAVEARTDAARLTTKLLEGRYVDTSRAIPKGDSVSLTFEPAEPVQGLTRLRPLGEVKGSHGSYTAVSLQMHPGDDCVRMRIADGSEDLFPAEFEVSEPVEAALNAVYLANVCRAESGPLQMQVFPQEQGSGFFLLYGECEHVIAGIRL